MRDDEREQALLLLINRAKEQAEQKGAQEAAQ